LQKLKSIITVIILALIIGLFIYYLKNHISDFKQISFVKPHYIIILVLFTLFISWTNGLIIKYIAEPFGVKLKFKEWFGLSIITSFYNIITPFKGGLAAKAIYLKKYHNFSYTNFLSSWAGLYVINFFTGSFLGLISLYLIYIKHHIFNIVVTLLFALFFIPMLIIILFSPEFKETKYEYLNKFIRAINGWNVIRKNIKIIIIASLTIIIQILVNSLAVIIFYHIINVELGLEKAIFLSTVGIVGILVQITPAGLGINEALAVFFGLVVGITPAQALTVAVIYRVISMAIMFTLGPIFSVMLVKKGNI